MRNLTDEYGNPIGGGGNITKRLPESGRGGLVGRPTGYVRLTDPSGPPSSTTPGGPGTPAPPPTYGQAPQVGGNYGLGGGAFGGGSSGGSFRQPPVNVDPYQEPNDQGMNDLIAQHLKGVLSGNESRYNPEVVSAMKSGLFNTTQGRLKATSAGIKEDQVSRGMYRSGQTGQLLANARMGADATYSQGVQDIAVKKATADFEDKMAALDRSEKWLEGMRQYALNVDMTKIERAKLQSNIALAWAKLEQDRQLANAQMALSRDTTNAQMQLQWGLNEPREGRDFIYMTDENGNRQMIWLSALDRAGNFYQGA